jgi:hypothetical protein
MVGFRSFGDNKIQKIMVLYELRFWKKDKSANIHLAVGDFGKDTIGFRKSSSSLLSYFVGRGAQTQRRQRKVFGSGEVGYV